MPTLNVCVQIHMNKKKHNIYKNCKIYKIYKIL